MQATQKLAGKKKVDIKARLEEEAAAAEEEKEGLFVYLFFMSPVHYVRFS